MKNTTLVLVTLFCTITLSAQCRFIDRVFPSIIISQNVVYGNAPQITPVYISEATTIDIDLHVDIKEPQGDTMQHRPVIIMAYPGGFFTGSKDTDDMQALADTFAHHGYVTCSMQYRMFFNLLSSESAERAAYRPVQDLDALIRFLIENDDTYHIDPNQIFFVGSSAGAFTGLHHIFMDENERTPSTYSGFLRPDLGCKSCTGNNFNHEAKIKAMASLWGAIGDTSWINKAEHDVPLILFHGDLDPTVPYGHGYPFTVYAVMPKVFGSSIMNERLNNQNITHEFYTGENGLHEYWGTVNGYFITPPNSNYPVMVDQINTFFYNQLSNAPCILATENYNTTNWNIHTQQHTVFIENNLDPIKEIFAFDAQGKQLLHKKVNDYNTNISLTEHGFYIFYIFTDKETLFYKIII